MPRLKSRRRELFAIEVAAGAPLDRAYVLAGYSDTVWARFNASKLAHMAEVAERINELQEDFRERSGINAAYVQRQLLPLIESNAKDLYEPVYDGRGVKTGERLKSISDLPRNLAAAISKVKCDPETGAVTEITLAGKTEAGSVLLRSIGSIVDRHSVDVHVPLDAAFAELLERLTPADRRALMEGMKLLGAGPAPEAHAVDVTPTAPDPEPRPAPAPFPDSF